MPPPGAAHNNRQLSVDFVCMYYPFWCVEYNNVSVGGSGSGICFIHKATHLSSIPSHLHTYIHTYIHIYTHTYIHRHRCLWFTQRPPHPRFSSHPIPSHPIPSLPSHPIPSHPIPSHPLPSHPILLLSALLNRLLRSDSPLLRTAFWRGKGEQNALLM